MSEWREFHISELATSHSAARVPLSKMEREARRGNYPYYGASGVIDYVDNFLFDGEYVLVSEDGENLKTRQTPIAFKAKGKFWVNNHAHVMQGHTEWLNDLLVYYFQNLDLSEYLTGAVQPKLNKANLESIKFFLPVDPDEQRAIASVLSSLDAKNDLLHRQNKTLEAMAEALFRQWFTGQRATGEETVLGSVVNVLEAGRRPSGGVFGISSGVPSIGAESIVGLGHFDYSKTKYVPREYYESMQRGKIQDMDVLLYKDGGTPGEFEPHATMVGRGFPFTECCINEHVFRIRTEPVLPQSYLYFWLTSDATMEEMRNSGTGAAIPGLTSSAVRELPILKPSPHLLKQFTDAVDPMVARILANCRESRTLANLRDTLLPKLMSGEVRVDHGYATL